MSQVTSFVICFATSIGGSVTGRGGDLILIDDPMKPEEALSELRREAVNQWFDGTLYVLLPERAPWLQDFQTEILRFPYGRHDDQVDSLSHFLMWIIKPRHYGPQSRTL